MVARFFCLVFKSHILQHKLIMIAEEMSTSASLFFHLFKFWTLLCMQRIYSNWPILLLYPELSSTLDLLKAWGFSSCSSPCYHECSAPWIWFYLCDVLPQVHFENVKIATPTLSAFSSSLCNTLCQIPLPTVIQKTSSIIYVNSLTPANLIQRFLAVIKPSMSTPDWDQI